MNPNQGVSDHDLLVRIDERVVAIHQRLDSIDKWKSGHEKSHSKTMKVLGAIAAGIGALTGFVTHFFTRN